MCGPSVRWLQLGLNVQSHPSFKTIVVRLGKVVDNKLFLGCWGPCYTMSSHAALGVVRAGVAVLKGQLI
jgi:hypothetical protein